MAGLHDFRQGRARSLIQADGPDGSVLMSGRVKYGNNPRVFRLSPADHPFMLNDQVVAKGLQKTVFVHAMRHRDRLFFEKDVDRQSEQEHRWVIWDSCPVADTLAFSSISAELVKMVGHVLHRFLSVALKR